MRKLVYLPHHMKDRLLKFRQRHEMMDEQIAIIRLLDAGLTAEEEKHIKKQQSNEQKNEQLFDPTRYWPWPNWGSFYK